MVDVLGQLGPFRWRGQAYPILRRRVSFRHEGVEHTIQYRDFEFVEQLGAHGLTFAYTIPLRESVAKGTYKHLFEQGLPQLTRDMLNREAGTLEDPILGIKRCVPNAYDDETDPLKRCGTDVSVEFRHSPELADEDPALKDLSGVAGLTSDAGKLDEEVAKANWGQEPSPEPMIDALQAADGVLSQGLAQVEKASAALADYALKMKNLEATCEKVADPANWGIRDQARTNRARAINLNQRLGESPGTKIRAFSTKTRMLITELAKAVGMTLEELLALNPGLSRMPFIPPNTLVLVRSAQRAA